jgi:hypothetical protein
VLDNLTEQWAEVWAETIARAEDRTSVPASEWRVAGRRTKANPDGETLDFWQSEGLRQVESYVEWFSNTGWSIATLPDGKPGIEWQSEVSFGGAPVRLVVDCVYTNGEDLIVCDYKTGQRVPYGQEQLALYASAIERAYGVRPKWGAFYMSRKGELSDLVDLSPWGIDYFDFMFTSMNEAMALGHFPPSVGDHCSYCSFSAFCPAVDGTKSAEYPLRIVKEDK